MMKITYREQMIPDGEYAALITSVVMQNTRRGECLRVKVQITEPSSAADGSTMSTLMNPVLTAQSRLSKWVEAAMGHPLANGTEVDLEEMIGKTVRVTNQNKANENGNHYPRIMNVRSCQPQANAIQNTPKN